MTWVILGASSGLGRALAECLAAERKSLLIVARDSRDLAALAADLRTRFAANVGWCAADATDPDRLRDALSKALSESLPVEALLFPIGAVSEDDRADRLPSNDDLVKINFLSVVAVLREFLPQMLSRGRGVIIGFGSIAAVRGRSNNALYSASKAALQRFFESLRHACDQRGVAVQFYVLGYLDTRLAFGRKLLLPKADPSRVARWIVHNISRGGGTWYLPKFWKVIAAVVRYLPWPIFRRLDF